MSSSGTGRANYNDALVNRSSCSCCNCVLTSSGISFINIGRHFRVVCVQQSPVVLPRRHHIFPSMLMHVMCKISMSAFDLVTQHAGVHDFVMMGHFIVPSFRGHSRQNPAQTAEHSSRCHKRLLSGVRQAATCLRRPFLRLLEPRNHATSTATCTCSTALFLKLIYGFFCWPLLYRAASCGAESDCGGLALRSLSTKSNSSFFIHFSDPTFSCVATHVCCHGTCSSVLCYKVWVLPHQQLTYSSMVLKSRLSQVVLFQKCVCPLSLSPTNLSMSASTHTSCSVRLKVMLSVSQSAGQALQLPPERLDCRCLCTGT